MFPVEAIVIWSRHDRPSRLAWRHSPFGLIRRRRNTHPDDPTTCRRRAVDAPLRGPGGAVRSADDWQMSCRYCGGSGDRPTTYTEQPRGIEFPAIPVRRRARCLCVWTCCAPEFELGSRARLTSTAGAWRLVSADARTEEHRGSATAVRQSPQLERRRVSEGWHPRAGSSTGVAAKGSGAAASRQRGGSETPTWWPTLGDAHDLLGACTARVLDLRG